MKYFYMQIFSVFIVINFASALFCAQERPLKKDIFKVYSQWFREIFIPSNSKIRKKNIELFRQELLQFCPESQLPVSFEEYYEQRNIVKLSVETYDFQDYNQEVLYPWIVEEREKRLPPPKPNFLQQVALCKALDRILSCGVVKMIGDYSHEITSADLGMDSTLTIAFKDNDNRKNKLRNFQIKVPLTATFDQVKENLGGLASIDPERIELYTRYFWADNCDYLPIKNMQSLVYMGMLAGGAGSLLYGEKKP